MTSLSLREEFARLGPIRAIDRVSSGSPAVVVLRMGELGDVKTVTAAISLYRPGLTMLRGKRAMEAMLDDGEAYSRMVSELQAGGHELDHSDSVKTMPRGYAEYSDHPLADHLRLKQLVVNRALPTSAWLDDTVAERIAEFAIGVGPLLRFVARAAVVSDPHRS